MKIVILIIFLFTILAACAEAGEIPVESIIELENKLNILKSEIFITEHKSVENYKNENTSLYYIKNKAWLKSLKSISPSDVATAAEYKNYKSILYGISLQGTGNKKQALKFYNKVRRDSVHYATAQLNISLLYFHDGYIDKAIDKIVSLLSDPSINIRNKIKNRALIVLGCLYIKDEKFNKSKIIFRKISAGSIYLNRAIIGFSTASNQLKDYSASEKVLLFLRENITYDLAVDESYIMLAYTYESQGNYAKAAKAYEKAIDHYSKRIKDIDKLLYEGRSLNIDKEIDKHVFVVSNNKIDLLEKLPDRFFMHYSSAKKLLIKTSGFVDSKNEMHKRASALVSGYRKIIIPLLIDQLLIRKNILLEYLNQSRYRFATSEDRLLLSR